MPLAIYINECLNISVLGMGCLILFKFDLVVRLELYENISQRYTGPLNLCIFQIRSAIDKTCLSSIINQPSCLYRGVTWSLF